MPITGFKIFTWYDAKTTISTFLKINKLYNKQTPSSYIDVSLLSVCVCLSPDHVVCPNYEVIGFQY